MNKMGGNRSGGTAEDMAILEADRRPDSQIAEFINVAAREACDLAFEGLVSIGLHDLGADLCTFGFELDFAAVRHFAGATGELYWLALLAHVKLDFLSFHVSLLLS